jgi:hypothetical protein
VIDGAGPLRAVSERDGGADRSSETRRFAGLPSERQRLLLHMDELMSSIPFGTVVVVLQDGKVIQIETSEKIRLR